MKPHPRIRKTIKWSGAAVTVLLVMVWIGSGWGYAFWNFAPGRGVVVGGGQISYWDDPSDSPAKPLEVRRWGVFKVYWWFSSQRGPFFWVYWAPLWLPVLACGLPALAAWRLDALARRRAHVGKCIKCGYDRAGLAPAALCPECGKLPA